jgi:hypothetical protein
VTGRRFQDVWKEQCSAASSIKERFGSKDAFDYLVGEKLMTFAEAASTRPEFARELPRFVAEVRRLFSADEIQRHVARIEREEATEDGSGELVDLEDFETRERIAERRNRFAVLKELLTSAQLGAS